MGVTSRRWAVIAAVVLLVPLAAAAQEGPGPVAAVSVAGAGVSFQPVISGYESLKLTVTGPGGFVHEQEFGSGSHPSFSLFDAAGGYLADGSYTWELRAAPRVSGATRKALQSARAYGRELSPLELSQLGLPPAESLVQSGHFRIQGGGIVTGDAVEPSGSMSVEPTTSLGLVTEGDPQPFPVLTNSDATIRNSLCVGLDCADAESFGFDTIRVKENNTRIQFDDTSSGSFPTNNWQIRANSSANGGANFLAFVDQGATGTSETGTLVFAVEAGAGANSLYVDTGNRVGFGTSTPVLNLHTVTGNTPALRLEQNGSSGFGAQTWDVAGNEAGFFVRDATNGSTLPFRILPGAASSSLVIDGDDEVGIGAGTNPQAKLHVKAATAAGVDVQILENNGPARLKLRNTAATNSATEDQDWVFNSNGTLRLSAGGDAAEFTLDAAGNLTVIGSYRVNGTTLNVPDYVFGPDYDLMPLPELKSFVETNHHLPDVPTAEQVSEQGLDMTDMQLKLLRKVEELTLYTLQQQELIEQLKEKVATLERDQQ